MNTCGEAVCLGKGNHVHLSDRQHTTGLPPRTLGKQLRKTAEDGQLTIHATHPNQSKSLTSVVLLPAHHQITMSVRPSQPAGKQPSQEGIPQDVAGGRRGPRMSLRWKQPPGEEQLPKRRPPPKRRGHLPTNEGPQSKIIPP